jgi:hypothetical protein
MPLGALQATVTYFGRDEMRTARKLKDEVLRIL